MSHFDRIVKTTIRLLFASAFIFSASTSWAALGDHSVQITSDAQFFHGHIVKPQLRKSSLRATVNCYKVADIESNGVHIREYINVATDTVFMIRANSRIFIDVKKLMGATDYAEYKSAMREHNGSFRFNRRSQRAIGVNTADIKIRFQETSLIHRTLMIQKNLVPSCVANPEALP